MVFESKNALFAKIESFETKSFSTRNCTKKKFLSTKIVQRIKISSDQNRKKARFLLFDNFCPHSAIFSQNFYLKSYFLIQNFVILNHCVLNARTFRLKTRFSQKSLFHLNKKIDLL